MMSSDEVDADDGTLDSGKEKCPLKLLPIQDKLHRLVTPRSYRAAIRASQGWAWRCNRRVMWQDAEGGPGVHEETPVCKLVSNVHQLAGSNDIDKPPDT